LAGLTLERWHEAHGRTAVIIMPAFKCESGQRERTFYPWRGDRRQMIVTNASLVQRNYHLNIGITVRHRNINRNYILISETSNTFRKDRECFRYRFKAPNSPNLTHPFRKKVSPKSHVSTDVQDCIAAANQTLGTCQVRINALASRQNQATVVPILEGQSSALR